MLRQNVLSAFLDLFSEQVIELLIVEITSRNTEKPQNIHKPWSRIDEIRALGDVMSICTRIKDDEGFQNAFNRRNELVTGVVSGGIQRGKMTKLLKETRPLMRIFGKCRTKSLVCID
jgi:hypothetical protein